MKEELYRKVYIKTKADLPTKNGEYFVKIKTPPFTQELTAVGFVWEHDENHINSFWLTKVDWYLQPIEQSESKTAIKTAEEILKKHLINTDWGDTNDLEREMNDNKDQVNAIVRAMEEYRQQPGVTDEEIEKYFTSQHYDNKNGHHYRMNKDRIFGAKAMRDGKIKPQNK
jgi:hypothetical protein